MVTATLTFELPDDAHSHRCAVLGEEMYSTLHDIDERLRSLLKHGTIDEKYDSAADLAEEIRDEIRDVLIAFD